MNSPPPAAGLRPSLTRLLGTAQGVLQGFLDLLAAELRLAGVSLSAMIALALAAGVLLVTTWLLLIGALACWIVVPETGWAAVLGALAVLNALVAAGLMVYLRVRSRDLLFARVRHHFYRLLQQWRE